jgi:hypothetical protein
MREVILICPDGTTDAEWDAACESAVDKLTADILRHTDPPTPENYMTAEEAGRHIGSDRQRIADLTYQKKIRPAGYDGRKPLYRRADLDAYLGGN